MFSFLFWSILSLSLRHSFHQELLWCQHLSLCPAQDSLSCIWCWNNLCNMSHMSVLPSVSLVLLSLSIKCSKVSIYWNSLMQCAVWCPNLKSLDWGRDWLLSNWTQLPFAKNHKEHDHMKSLSLSRSLMSHNILEIIESLLPSLIQSQALWENPSKPSLSSVVYGQPQRIPDLTDEWCVVLHHCTEWILCIKLHYTLVVYYAVFNCLTQPASMMLLDIQLYVSSSSDR